MKTIRLSLITCLTMLSFCSLAYAQRTLPRLGIAGGLNHDSIAHASGFKFIGESVRKMLAPPLTDAEFLANLKKIQTAKAKVLVCNLFFPANIKIAGPAVDENKVLDYAEIVLSRAKQAGIKFIVLGSSGSRSIPDGYDLNKAKAAFVQLSKKLGAIAKKNEVVIVLENLETTETNFITSLKAAAEIVKQVDHPNFRLNADIFHMMREGESPEEIIAAGKLIAFCEVAEKEKRTLPGVKGDDFKPYFHALKKINYEGFIFIEGSISNAAIEIPLAFKYLNAQLAAVYVSEKK